jgi:hypothetical protein
MYPKFGEWEEAGIHRQRLYHDIVSVPFQIPFVKCFERILKFTALSLPCRLHGLAVGQDRSFLAPVVSDTLLTFYIAVLLPCYLDELIII